ncbi:hypothetical protein Tco_0820387 [Tanacetum coccineum]|uniref:Uncharacterized protein n=1 Tax=Tanacetum coccineum TaxID=301880 RepID=A0ABQ5ADB5_9ASTR
MPSSETNISNSRRTLCRFPLFPQSPPKLGFDRYSKFLDRSSRSRGLSGLPKQIPHRYKLAIYSGVVQSLAQKGVCTWASSQSFSTRESKFPWWIDNHVNLCLYTMKLGELILPSLFGSIFHKGTWKMEYHQCFGKPGPSTDFELPQSRLQWRARLFLRVSMVELKPFCRAVQA